MGVKGDRCEYIQYLPPIFSSFFSMLQTLFKCSANSQVPCCSGVNALNNDVHLLAPVQAQTFLSHLWPLRLHYCFVPDQQVPPNSHLISECPVIMMGREAVRQCNLISYGGVFSECRWQPGSNENPYLVSPLGK